MLRHECVREARPNYNIPAYSVKCSDSFRYYFMRKIILCDNSHRIYRYMRITQRATHREYSHYTYIYYLIFKYRYIILLNNICSYMMIGQAASYSNQSISLTSIKRRQPAVRDDLSLLSQISLHVLILISMPSNHL